MKVRETKRIFIPCKIFDEGYKLPTEPYEYAEKKGSWDDVRGGKPHPRQNGEPRVFPYECFCRCHDYPAFMIEHELPCCTIHRFCGNWNIRYDYIDKHIEECEKRYTGVIPA